MAFVLEILTKHRGNENAVTGRWLAHLLGQKDDRGIREEIRELIRQGVPIASSTRPPYGYYLAATPEEAERYCQQLKSRLVEDALRRRDFKKAAANAFDVNGQLRLF